MSGKKGGKIRPASPLQHEWRVMFPAGTDVQVTSSALFRGADGDYSFRDERGIVADFAAGKVMGVLRKPPERKEPVRVRLPARFVTTPSSVQELQGALGAALGVQVILISPGTEDRADEEVPKK